MARVLVTGGAGFIGANLTRLLGAKGYDVSVLDNLSRGQAGYLPDPGILIQADINDRPAGIRAMQGADIVIHLAAYGSVVESVADPLPNFRTNAEGTLSALECARQAKVKRFVFASTGGALIGNAEPPVDELSLPRPISPYGASKLCGEAYCHAYASSLGLPTVALRFANVYGPYSGHKKGAVTQFMKCILAGEPIPIFGDGTASRDYLHVGDLCEGITQAAEAEIAPGQVFHLASGEETSVLGLARLISEVAGVPGYPIEFHEKRAGEVDRNFARYDRARAAFGFAPRRRLEEGLRETWLWFREHHGGPVASARTP